ncbi:unnamed protein product [Coregonus sp. 'balchen']|nr:unnamed protein product [Coregonus sp. 'balchen']
MALFHIQGEGGLLVDERNVSRCFKGYHHNTDDEKRSVATIHLIIVVCFVLVFFIVVGPWTLAVLEIKEGWGSMDWDQRTRQWLNDAHQVTLMLMGLNCLLDPMVSCFATRKFRLYIKDYLKKLGRGKGCSETAITQMYIVECKNVSQSLHSEQQQLEI